MVVSTRREAEDGLELQSQKLVEDQYGRRCQSAKGHLASPRLAERKRAGNQKRQPGDQRDAIVRDVPG